MSQCCAEQRTAYWNGSRDAVRIGCNATQADRHCAAHHNSPSLQFRPEIFLVNADQSGDAGLRARWEWLGDTQIWASLLTLTALEIVLGVDNLVFLTILTSRLPPERQSSAGGLGWG